MLETTLVQVTRTILNYVLCLFAEKRKRVDWHYIGYTSNLEKRFKEHQNGLSESTKPYRPLELIFYEVYKSKLDAKRRETYFKTNRGKRVLKLMLKDSLK